MAKPRDDMYDLFGGSLDEPVVPEPPKPKAVKIPSKELVDSYVKKTGKSTRQCYFWALAELNN